MPAEVVTPLAALAALYGLGAWRLSRRGPAAIGATRLVAGVIGFLAIVIALLSPLDELVERSFAAHMLQHMLLMMIAAPALLLADPFPVVMWGLPSRVRRRVGGWLAGPAPLRRLWRHATAMPLAWGVFAATVWSWHLPIAYDAALSDRMVHDLEHVAFFGAAVLFWWPIIHPAPRVRPPAPPALRIVYLVLAAFQTAGLGLALTLAPIVLYRTYAATHSGTVDALADQTWGGIVMWGLGGLIEMLAVLVLLYRSFGDSEKKFAKLGDGGVGAGGPPTRHHDEPLSPFERSRSATASPGRSEPPGGLGAISGPPW